MSKTYVYVDALNLYYGALRRTPLRWLNLKALCASYLPNHNIYKIKYFTAHVQPSPRNPRQHARQMTYIRALNTLPEMEVIYGHFLQHTVRMPKADGTGSVNVIKTEEKASDVNIATHLLVDGFREEYDTAVLVSGDSDFLEPVRFIQSDLKKKIGVLNPQKRPCRVLHRHATFYKHIRKSVLRDSQFSDQMTDDKGVFIKPSDW